MSLEQSKSTQSTPALTELKLPHAKLSPVEPLKPAIEEFLGGGLQSRQNSDLVESYLCQHAGRAQLVLAAHELCKTLEARGYTSSLQYGKCVDLQHPVPVITTVDSAGRYIVPAINALWSKPDQIERGNSGATSNKKQVITDDSVEEAGDCQWQSLGIEKFSADAPVSIILLPPQQLDTPAYAHTLCSPAAFREALTHAATSVINNSPSEPSFIRRDVLEPHLRAFIRRSSQLFGEREIPEITDNGTSTNGGHFNVGVFVPLPSYNQHAQLHLEIVHSDWEYQVRGVKTTRGTSA